jgi:hypothetical protein
MIYSDETQRALRANNCIAEIEIAMQSGDLILAENVLTKERRILDLGLVRPHINTAKITETKNNVKLLKG